LLDCAWLAAPQISMAQTTKSDVRLVRAAARGIMRIF
jgi:hypothetical protein